MSLISKFTSIFSKQEATGFLGIALRPEGVAFCHLSPSSEINIVSNDLLASSYQHQIQKTVDEHDMEGECHLVLASNQYQIVQIDKPNIPEEEMNSALKWQIKDQVTYSPDDMVVDYFDGPTLAGGVKKINVVCASASPLQIMVSSLIAHDIQLKSIITPEFAFANLLPVQDDATLLVCQQPDEEILILIVKQGQLFFHRRLRGFTKIAHMTEMDLASGMVDSLSIEIQRSIDYFERQLKQAPIKSIQLLLPMETESFLAGKLAENTPVPVVLLCLPKVYSEYRSSATAIGACLYSIGLPVPSVDKSNNQKNDEENHAGNNV